MQLSGQKVLVVGATGKVAGPVATALADDNEVWGASRFSDPSARSTLESVGVRCVELDLIDGTLDALPTDFDYVINFSVVKTKVWDADLDGNAGGIGRVMFHCPTAKAVLHCSSTAVYAPDGHHRLTEDSPMGDNHRPLVGMATYSISKIAAEAMVRFCCTHIGVPTTIARLNVPYGPRGFWPAHHLAAIEAGTPIPVHVNAPSEYNPIHLDDVIAMIAPLLAAAAVPATAVNWAGNDVVSIEEWCAYIGELVGREPVFAPTENTIESVAIDVTRMHQLVGKPTVHWRDGLQRMVAELATRPG